MIEAYVTGVSVVGPGLDGWTASRPILAGVAPYDRTPIALRPPEILSATERRRTGPVARLALSIAQEASTMAMAAPGSLRSVFASSNGDGAVVTAILEALAEGDGLVSPTQFHNSVHNAAAGYWSIATRSSQPATCLGCHDATFAAGLLTAVAEAAVECQPVLLCVYDLPMPAPLDAHRPLACGFGIGLVLEPAPTTRALARIAVRHVAEPADPARTVPRLAFLRDLADGNPAAQGLRLLEALALGAPDDCSLGYLDGRLDVGVRP